MTALSRSEVFGPDVIYLGDTWSDVPDETLPPPNFEEVLRQDAAGEDEDFPARLLQALRMSSRSIYRTYVKQTDRGSVACVLCMKERERVKAKETKLNPTKVARSTQQPPQGDTYRFEPLADVPSIRILELEPATGSEDPLRGALKIYPNRKAAVYTALSYTWTGVDKDGSLDLGTGLMKITGNLDLALRTLRKTDTTLCIWVDAICINQKDKKEKGVQVSQMGSIYGDAASVTAWLGPETAQTSSALECMMELANLSKSATYDERARVLSVPTLGIGTFPMAFEEAVRIQALRKSKHLDDILKRVFFSRLWIVQEVLLAKKLILHLGRCSIDWEDFRRAVKMYWAAERQIPAHVYAAEKVETNLPMQAIVLVEARDQHQRFDQGRIVFEDYTTQTYGAAESFATWGCKDERDRIYAILSLAPKGSDVTLLPDYDAEPEKIYTDFARRHVLHEGLAILHFAGLERRNEVMDFSGLISSKDDQDPSKVNADSKMPLDLPSWVPEPRPQKARSMKRVWRPLYFQTAMMWKPAVILHKKCPHMIAVNGGVLDTISQPIPVSVTREEGKTGVMDFIEVLRYCGFVWRFSKEHYEERGGYPNGQSHASVFDGVFTAGDNMMNFISLSEQPTKGEGWVGKMLALLHAAFDGGSASPIQNAVQDESVAAEDIPLFLSAISMLLADNLIILTSNGLMGFAPNCMEAGDVIAWINGLNSPVVLRPACFEGQYRIVGPCYLHGIMNGELSALRHLEKMHTFLELV